MLRGRGGDPAKPRSASSFQPKYAEGFTFALLSTLGYGSSPLLVRAAFEEGGWGLGASLAGGLVSYVAGTIVMGAFIASRKQLNHVLSMDRGAARWFVWSGINVCVAQVFRYMSLAVAPVSVVAPIMQLQVVFRLIFGWSINREHEVFTVWMLIGTAISLLGAVALSVSTEFVIDLFALPDWVVAAARWRWP